MVFMDLVGEDNYGPSSTYHTTLKSIQGSFLIASEILEIFFKLDKESLNYLLQTTCSRILCLI